MTVTAVEKPILFKPEMVRTILNGSKTQTRRIVKVPPPATETDSDIDIMWALGEIKQPYHKGEILWVREVWARYCDRIIYKADETPGLGVVEWKPSIHMKRCDCRLRLQITDIRVERVQDIREEDAKSEGLEVKEGNYKIYGTDWWTNDPGISFRSLWESINGKQSWSLNCWVWVVEFRKL